MNWLFFRIYALSLISLLSITNLIAMRRRYLSIARNVSCISLIKKRWYYAGVHPCITLIHEALDGGIFPHSYEKELQKLIKSKQLVINSLVPGQKITFLSYAAQYAAQSPFIVQGLLEIGADPTFLDERGRNPLHYLASKKHYLQDYRGLPIIVDSLLYKGANINQQDKRGETPLHVVPLEALETLIAEGASLDIKSDYYVMKDSKDNYVLDCSANILKKYARKVYISRKGAELCFAGGIVGACEAYLTNSVTQLFSSVGIIGLGFLACQIEHVFRTFQNQEKIKVQRNAIALTPLLKTAFYGYEWQFGELVYAAVLHNKLSEKSFENLEEVLMAGQSLGYVNETRKKAMLIIARRCFDKDFLKENILWKVCGPRLDHLAEVKKENKELLEGTFW